MSRSLKLAVLGCTLLAGGCDRGADAPAQPQESAAATPPDAPGAASKKLDRSHKGEPLPRITVKDAEGKTLALPSLKGKPALVNLWATWCAPCIAELPTLDAIAAEGRIAVVTVSQDMGKPEEVAAFLKAKGGENLPAWLDPENDLAFQYGGGVLPTSVLYDAEGREVWRYVGGNEWDNAEARALLAEAG
ncbi:TlpA disulfide reductase family protein [Novosphingobium sp. PC22D]|uniref:TlpA family protein disulfide reductase n=1 Tax=Novosphingobium sp. PC22D TaxID=1962403 RepID=UPI001F0A8BE0|nr:TlpA disulfide reductase family protein [Novosphingobium sp. PC22D]